MQFMTLSDDHTCDTVAWSSVTLISRYNIPVAIAIPWQFRNIDAGMVFRVALTANREECQSESTSGIAKIKRRKSQTTKYYLSTR
jgi:hypothetical protein